MDYESNRFFNRAAAYEYTETIQNREAKAFVDYGITTVLLNRRIPASESPEVPIDLKYLSLVLVAMYANKGALELILQGKPEELGFGP